ncbi:glutaminase A [Bacillus carboniphilus]|uniref:Glutaminase n=1 Tax=Bacillus carboniphilus TaxID=86663 RepID=A0ABY9JW87_9BACI|nr:glutaminase A [Bacillus carboniphilus]WLR43662.1 glutaminase A [Bacillus carboniphilus]
MHCKKDEQLQRIINQVKSLTTKGKLADYIPALANENKEHLCASIYYLDKTCVSAGDVEHSFTLQSISKVLSLALVLMDHGEEYVFEHVGMEPTGDPFNSIVKLETNNPSKPLNPMINAGALAVTNMIKGSDKDEQFTRLLNFIKELADSDSITYDTIVAQSEYNTAWLNRSLCYFMKEHDIIKGSVDHLIEVYTKQCSIKMHSIELAKTASVFANNGLHPSTNKRVIPEKIAQLCKTFMVTCGMYNASGEFAIKVGVPAKSGVSGGILAVVPELCGIGIFGPALDDKGNSIAGIGLLERLSANYKLSIF